MLEITIAIIFICVLLLLFYNRKEHLNTITKKTTISSVNTTPFDDDNDNITITILHDFSDNTLNNFNNMQKKLLQNKKSKVKPHITIHVIHFNKKHPLINHFIDLSDLSNMNLTSSFRQSIINSYNTTLKNKLQLHHNNEFSKMGKFYALTYHPNSPPDNTNKYKYPYITQFRHSIYNYIDTIAPTDKKYIEIKRNNKNNPGKIDDYRVYYNDKIPLYAIQDYFHGIGNWHPHVSLVREQELQINNSLLFNKVNNKDKNTVREEIKNYLSNVNILNNIMINNLIRISIFS